MAIMNLPRTDIDIISVIIYMELFLVGYNY